MFLHPTRLTSTDDMADLGARDPDAPLIAGNHARSAVLFGPPGTSKTTLVEALAGALGWQYVEILASDFLSGGVDAVPAKADLIFERLMQMNRCVVLFDEIDELIRDRTNEQSDPFGRFLTTSMLPKIAKLWKQRRIIFFVATNHVRRADPAITRSSRFDARIFVAPPGLSTKRSQLSEALGNRAPKIDDDLVQRSLSLKESDRAGLTESQKALAVMPLLRFDQVPELIRAIRGGRGQVKDDVLLAALSELRDRLVRHEWQPARPADGWHKKSPDEKLRHVYAEFLEDSTRDESRQLVMVMDRNIGGANKWPVLATRTEFLFVEAPDTLPEVDVDGEIRIEHGRRPVTDQMFLHFAPSPPAGQSGTLSRHWVMHTSPARLSFLDAAATVLAEEGVPLDPRQITDIAVQHGLIESDGATPSQTMKAKFPVFADFTSEPFASITEQEWLLLDERQRLGMDWELFVASRERYKAVGAVPITGFRPGSGFAGCIAYNLGLDSPTEANALRGPEVATVLGLCAEGTAVMLGQT
jgi:hypothetical protein